MDFPRTAPSSQGVDATGILAFLDAVERHELIEPHGLIIQRHGHRITEGSWAPHTPERLRLVYSLSKTFTGTALGLQLDAGLLSLDDLVSDHLPELFDDDTPDATRRMKIRHIASMSSGHDREILGEAIVADRSNVVRAFLHIPPDAEPGTLFAYNQPPVLALAMILQRLAGERVSDYLRPRLLEPLGVHGLRWAQFAPGLDMGFSGVHTNLDAVARLGQLYLDHGVWDGKQLLSADWVAEASHRHIDTPLEERVDWREGYGMQVWMSRHGYRGDGAFGQYMVILPEHDAVIAMFSCVEDMQAVLDAMWEHLLPAMGGEPLQGSAADDALLDRLAGLRLPTVAERIDAKPIERTALDGVPTMFTPGVVGEHSHRSVTSIEIDGQELVIRERESTLRLPLTADWRSDPGSAVSASAAAVADGRLAVDAVFLDTPHRLEIELDPATATFTANWWQLPLFGAGPPSMLANFKMPAD